jgi:hypothetical protein
MTMVVVNEVMQSRMDRLVSTNSTGRNSAV